MKKQNPDEGLEFRLDCSKPIKIFIPQKDGSTHAYTTSFRAPCNDYVQHSINLPDLMNNDGISLPAISTCLRRWAIEQGDVERLTLSSTGKSYSIAVLLQNIRDDRIRKAHIELLDIKRRFFGENRAIVYLLGKEQTQSLLFTRVDVYTVYP